MSSTAADVRGHVRQDSIAQKRTTPSKPAAAKSSRYSPGGGLASAGSRGSPSSPSGESLNPLNDFSCTDEVNLHCAGGNGFVVTPALAIKTTVVALVLFACLHFLPLSSTNSSSSATITTHEDRKALMDGSGEAWILPKRWREGETSVGGETLPECKRVMLFKFTESVSPLLLSSSKRRRRVASARLAKADAFRGSIVLMVSHPKSCTTCDPSSSVKS